MTLFKAPPATFAVAKSAGSLDNVTPSKAPVEALPATRFLTGHFILLPRADSALHPNLQLCVPEQAARQGKDCSNSFQFLVKLSACDPYFPR
jgi:hypothetical protein